MFHHRDNDDLYFLNKKISHYHSVYSKIFSILREITKEFFLIIILNYDEIKNFEENFPLTTILVRFYALLGIY